MIFNGLVNYISEIGGKYTKKIPSDKIEWHFFLFSYELIDFQRSFFHFLLHRSYANVLAKVAPRFSFLVDFQQSRATVQRRIRQG